MANQRILLKHKLLTGLGEEVVLGKRLGAEFAAPLAVESALDSFHERVYDAWLDESPNVEHYDKGYYIELEHKAEGL